jgi:hypothetical protein
VFDYGDGFTGQNGLVNTQSGGIDLAQTDIGRDFVTDRNLDNVTRYDFLRPDLWTPLLSPRTTLPISGSYSLRASIADSAFLS